MKKYLATRARLAVPYMTAAAMTRALFSPQMVDAQDAPEKIRLMAETLRARDSGDLETAKAKAEELIKIAPNDENVQRLNAAINREIERQGGGEAVYGQAADASAESVMAEKSAPIAPVAEASDEASSMVTEAAAEQEDKVAAAENAIDEAMQLADLGAYTDATNLLNHASASLSLNTATAETIADIQSAKAEGIFTEASALGDSGDYKGAEELLVDYLAAGGSA